MTRIYIRPYKAGSKSAKTLAEALGAKRLKLEGSTYRPRPTDVVINWGNSTAFNPGEAVLLNEPNKIARAANKLATFQQLAADNVPIPPYTADKEVAEEWLAGGATVVVRKKLSGHSGEGIEIVERGDLPNAPLYTKYVKKQEEYRVHCGFDGEGVTKVIFTQRKARKLDVADADVNWQVRNVAGGFVFAHQDVNAPAVVLDAAIQALVSLDLDFGAVDVIFNNQSGRAFVLEVNTACGMEGETVNKYVQFFRENYTNV